MKKNIITYGALLILAACNPEVRSIEKKDCCARKEEVAANPRALPSQSIFQIPDTFETQDGLPRTLSMFAGRPTVVGMVFTHCGYACPRLTTDMKNIADSLHARGDEINFLLVSFDTKRDTPARLKVFAKELELDEKWTLLHGNKDAVRTLSILLNVQYEEDTDGNFAHSNIISVLDKEGVLQYSKEGLEADHSETIGMIRQMIAAN